ncbi:MaoC family dehydratase [Ruegeria sp. SCPT10]|uniref:MaoC family dehydratase n=1 Tax=Ruegeria sp. SCP10 TaxID=3141377 RepID=UPI00333DBE49
MIELQESWTPTQAEFDAFAAVSGDNNAIHVDPTFCATTTFGRTVSHGMLIYTKLWGMLKRDNSAIRQVSQKLMFPNPAFTEEELELKITEKAPGLVEMRVIRLADGAECLLGEAEISC